MGEMGKNMRLIEELLNFLDLILSKNIRWYLDSETGVYKEMKDESFFKFIGQILYVLDYLFIEPSKSNYIQNVPTMARSIADHKFWKYFQNYTEIKHQNLMYMAMILFDDIMNELPENLIQTTLSKFQDSGTINHFLTYFEEKIPEDYDHLSFLVLFVQRVSFNEKCKD